MRVDPQSDSKVPCSLPGLRFTISFPWTQFFCCIFCIAPCPIRKHIGQDDRGTGQWKWMEEVHSYSAFFVSQISSKNLRIILRSFGHLSRAGDPPQKPLTQTKTVCTNSLRKLFLPVSAYLKGKRGDSLYKLSRNCLRKLCFYLQEALKGDILKGDIWKWDFALQFALENGISLCSSHSTHQFSLLFLRKVHRESTV